jgi:2-polyprenyl-6-methoxyphenol hydroxylase-like FAD-dependent oxidoreductase
MAVSADGHAVVVAGAGPTGLMLAGELALAGVDVAVVERRPDQELVGQRALGVTSRTIEVFDQRGIADRFLASGQVGQTTGFAWTRLSISDFPTRHNYGLGLGQQQIERILADWVAELGVPVHRGRSVTGFAQDADGVDVTLSSGPSLRAGYLVGCDGGRSAVRKGAGIEFRGWEASMSNLLGDVELDQDSVPSSEWGVQRDAKGLRALSRPEAGGPVRVMVPEAEAGRTDTPTLEDLRAELIRVHGTDFGLRRAVWLFRFTDMARQAVSYRSGRVLLAGDAAHVHTPMGGQGLSLGVQDAVNLGWKLGQVVHGTSPDSLLDTYHAERHPVGARVLHNTLAQIAISRSDVRTEALRDIMGSLLGMDEPRRYVAGMMSGLDIHYDLGAGHPLLGRRMPDLDLVTADGPLRVFSLLHAARPVLLRFGGPVGSDADARKDRVQVVDAEYTGTWELPVLGTVAAPDAVLVRPDGYVAWVGDGSREGLAAALGQWFGA